MSKRNTWLIALTAFGVLPACTVPESRTANGVITSDEPRIWVVRAIHTNNQVIDEVFRCADGSPADQPPKPLCVKAPMGE
jgi:hypothetical protein